MSDKEVYTISHLLEVEQKASELIAQAQADADKKIADAKSKADAMFQEQYTKIVSDCENSYSAKTSALSQENTRKIEDYKKTISASGQDRKTFNSYLDSILFA